MTIRKTPLALALLISSTVLAQEGQPQTTGPTIEAAAPKQNALYIAPFSILIGTVVVEYERALSEKASFFIAPQFTGSFGLAGIFNSLGVSTSGYGGTVGARFYFTGNAAPNGLFVGPELSASYLRAQLGDANVSGVGFSIGGTVGYSLLTDSGLALSIGAGLTLRKDGASVGTDANGQTEPLATPIYPLPSLRFHVGYAF